MKKALTDRTLKALKAKPGQRYEVATRWCRGWRLGSPRPDTARSY